VAAIYTPPWPMAEMFTTTLYPVVAVDSLGMNITVNNGAMILIPVSDIDNTFDALNGTLIQLRWFYFDGPYDGDIDNTFDALNGTLIQLRWFYFDGPYDGDIDNTFDALDGTLINKLVEADSPDEKLQLALRIEATSTMDLI